MNAEPAELLLTDQNPSLPSVMPALPAEVWGHVMDILATQRRSAATLIQAHFKRGFKTRIGPLRWILRYIRKGNLMQARMAYAYYEHRLRCGLTYVHGQHGLVYVTATHMARP
mmetsp:Transcript_24813/g.61617  ORF Transcript_24813/g.61617 Transcript_24813/m.61617 type:complete len:113 (-) Transcript_24813:91-429(-)